MRGKIERDAPRPAKLAGRWVLWTDIQLTRRKRYFIVENPQGENAYMAARISLALDWLDAHEIAMYVIATLGNGNLCRGGRNFDHPRNARQPQGGDKLVEYKWRNAEINNEPVLAGSPSL